MCRDTAIQLRGVVTLTDATAKAIEEEVRSINIFFVERAVFHSSFADC